MEGDVSGSCAQLSFGLVGGVSDQGEGEAEHKISERKSARKCVLNVLEDS